MRTGTPSEDLADHHRQALEKFLKAMNRPEAAVVPEPAGSPREALIRSVSTKGPVKLSPARRATALRLAK